MVGIWRWAPFHGRVKGTQSPPLSLMVLQVTVLWTECYLLCLGFLSLRRAGCAFVYPLTHSFRLQAGLWHRLD